MKKYTHAWLAMMAIYRLTNATMEEEESKYAKKLLTWLNNHRDFVIKGAWYPVLL